MDKSWVKLYRKTLDNGILRDPTCWVIFSWLLLKVDKNGKKTIGRFWASEELGLNSNTFYKALKRLEKKWQMVTLSGNNKNTEITLINWDKYQHNNGLVTLSGNNKVTTREQPGNTLQEYRIKNKEYINNGNSSFDESEIKKISSIPEEPTRGIYTEYQQEASRIMDALEVPKNRFSAYVKIIKEEPRSIILDAYAYVIDIPNKTGSDRDKLFFWKVNQLKNEKITKHNTI